MAVFAHTHEFCFYFKRWLLAILDSRCLFFLTALFAFSPRSININSINALLYWETLVSHKLTPLHSVWAVYLPVLRYWPINPVNDQDSLYAVCIVAYSISILLQRKNKIKGMRSVFCVLQWKCTNDRVSRTHLSDGEDVLGLMITRKLRRLRNIRLCLFKKCFRACSLLVDRDVCVDSVYIYIFRSYTWTETFH